MTRTEREEIAKKRELRLHMQVLTFANEIVLPAINMNVPGERYQIKISPIEIYNTYGANCEKIFRLLFTLHQVGGRSAEWNKSYVTMWVLNQSNLNEYCRIVDGVRGTKYSGKQILDEMIKAGCSESRRVKIGLEPEVLSGKELEEHMQLVSRLRQFERAEREYFSATYF